MQFTPQLHPSHIQLHHDKLTEELNASSALQEPVCAALPLPAHLQHRELASSDRVCTYWLHTLQLQRSQERKTRLISSRDPGTGSIKCLWVGFKECMKQHIRAIQLGTTWACHCWDSYNCYPKTKLTRNTKPLKYNQSLILLPVEILLRIC